MKKTKGTLFIISAPSGAGKSTLCKAVMGRMGNIRLAVSHTTRAPRKGEVDGVDYHFTTVDRFRAMIDAGDFLEWAEVHGNYYGTSRTMLNSLLNAGYDIFHDIDVQGARQVKPRLLEAVFVFILPPSLEALRERLVGRGTDAPEVIERRLSNAIGEIKAFSLYDYVIINDDLKVATEQLEAVVRAAPLRIGVLDAAWIENTFLRLEDG